MQWNRYKRGTRRALQSTYRHSNMGKLTTDDLKRKLIWLIRKRSNETRIRRANIEKRKLHMRKDKATQKLIGENDDGVRLGVWCDRIMAIEFSRIQRKIPTTTTITNVTLIFVARGDAFPCEMFLSFASENFFAGISHAVFVWQKEIRPALRRTE